ncbi:MAG: hypothetical protein H7Y32_00340 [Chloroflexales bacterium]|nr:hypothetical protein [Chloroflexales bacterium]
MVSKNGRLAEAATPEEGDDFKRISGIKAAIESRLHSAGILTYAQLAAASPEAIVAHLDDLKGFSAERVVQLDWTNKAAALAAEAAETAPPVRRHYASFKVELGLAEEGGVRSTRVISIQSGEEEKWAGWDAARLPAVIAEYAGLPPDAARPKQSLSIHEEVSQPAPITISKVEATLNDDEREVRFLHAGLPYRVMVTLELARALGSSNVNEAMVKVAARNLNSNQRHSVGEARTKLLVEGQTTVMVNGEALAPGMYRLEARLALRAAQPDDVAVFKGALVQIL